MKLEAERYWNMKIEEERERQTESVWEREKIFKYSNIKLEIERY